MLPVNVAIARASHFALFGGCFAHFYVMPGLNGHLCCYACNTDTFIFQLIVIRIVDSYLRPFSQQGYQRLS